mgnify:CR=1 FL=1
MVVYMNSGMFYINDKVVIFFNNPAPTEVYPLYPLDALPTTTRRKKKDEGEKSKTKKKRNKK